MTDPTIAELGAKFGANLGEAYAAVITLDKQLQLQTIQIQVLQARIAELEAQQTTHGSMSPKSAAIAAEGSAIIAQAQTQTDEKDLTGAESAAALGSINA